MDVFILVIVQLFSPRFQNKDWGVGAKLCITTRDLKKITKFDIWKERGGGWEGLGWQDGKNSHKSQM